jgi:hypothetical protein
MSDDFAAFIFTLLLGSHFHPTMALASILTLAAVGRTFASAMAFTAVDTAATDFGWFGSSLIAGHD